MVLGSSRNLLHIVFRIVKTPGPGPTATAVVSGDPSALDLLCRYFTEEVCDLVVVETIRFVGSAPEAHRYTLATVSEMKAFISVLLHTQKLLQLEMYWSTRNLCISTPSISNMSRVSFEHLYAFT